MGRDDFIDKSTSCMMWTPHPFARRTLLNISLRTALGEKAMSDDEWSEPLLSEVIGGWTFPISMRGGNDARWEQFVKGVHEGNLHLTAGGNRYAKKLMEDISNGSSVPIFLQLTDGHKIKRQKVSPGLAGIVEVDYEKLKENSIDNIREDPFYHEKFLSQRKIGGLSTREIVIPIKPITGTRIHLQDALCYSECRGIGWSPGRKLCKNRISRGELEEFKKLLK